MSNHPRISLVHPVVYNPREEIQTQSSDNSPTVEFDLQPPREQTCIAIYREHICIPPKAHIQPNPYAFNQGDDFRKLHAYTHTHAYTGTHGHIGAYDHGHRHRENQGGRWNKGTWCRILCTLHDHRPFRAHAHAHAAIVYSSNSRDARAQVTAAPYRGFYNNFTTRGGGIGSSSGVCARALFIPSIYRNVIHVYHPLLPLSRAFHCTLYLLYSTPIRRYIIYSLCHLSLLHSRDTLLDVVSDHIL